MEDRKDHLNELYRKILHGSARPGEKEKLAHWMAGLNVKRDEVSSDELAAEEQQSRNELRKRFLPGQRRVGFIRPWMIAASAAIIIFTTMLFITINVEHDKRAAITYSETETRAGERKRVTLADGSVITLNSASQLRYPVGLQDNNAREVFLDGQAFFEVSRDEDRPFIIHAGKLTVQVLGTSFDVRNYREDTDAAVTVVSGKVSVDIPEISGQYLLTPGEQLAVDKQNGIAEKRPVDMTDVLAWQNGGQVFRDRELREVCRILERTYGVTISIQSRDLGGQKMNLRIQGSEQIAGVMEMLATTGDFHYRIKGRTITLWK